jgi:hypothetical protein
MTMCKIFKSENSLRELNLKKSILQKLTDKVDKQIDKLTKSIYGDKLYTEHLKGKDCIVCANRDPEMDFRIPDGIVCTHPSNQNGKDMFKCYSHTCEFWKREKPIDEKFTKEYWESLKHFKNEHDIPDIPICITDEKKVFYNNVIVPNLIRCGAIAKKDLEVGVWYIGDNRNTERAKWNGKEFEYIRHKFGYTFTDTMNHFEDDNDCTLFVPLKKKK